MSYSIGDGIASLAAAAIIIGYLSIRHQARQKKMEIIHQERMAAMEKGIPLPEFPFDPESARREPDPTVIPILGMILLTLSVGAMIVLYLNLPEPNHGFWVSPLPFAFLGTGFLAYNLMQRKDGR
jgi:hypothetical protein